MRISEDRISLISHKIHDRLYLDEIVDYKEEEAALNAIKKVFLDFFQAEDEIHEIVARRILSQKKGILEGSREWDVLYNKYTLEEMTKRGL